MQLFEASSRKLSSSGNPSKSSNQISMKVQERSSCIPKPETRAFCLITKSTKPADDLVEARPPPARSTKEDDDAFEKWMATQYKEQQLRHEQIMLARHERQHDESVKIQLLQNAEASEEAKGELSMWHMA